MSVDTDMHIEGPTKLEDAVALPPALENLSKLVAEKPEALAIGSEDLRKAALDATKFIFDLGTNVTSTLSATARLTV